MSTNDGTIDLTNLVEQMRSTFVSWSVQFIIQSAASVPWLSWLRLPVIAPLFEFMLTKIIEALSKAVEMQAFFLNTALRKSAQAQDFIKAVEELKNLPPNVGDDVYEEFEKKRMVAFRNFVRVTN